MPGLAMATDPAFGVLGLPEPELRRVLEAELERAAGTERELSPHAIAHSVARVLELDHERVAEQLEGAGVRLDGGAAGGRSATGR
jgi:hypothetical protein